LHATASFQVCNQSLVPLDIHHGIKPRTRRDLLALRIPNDLRLLIQPKVALF
jgi:hypothetical protein